MKQKIASGNLDKLRKELERRLIVMRYSKTSAKVYMRIFGWLEDYLNGYGETDYSTEFGERFLMEYQLQSIHSPLQFKNARTVIRRMDEILENKLFTPCFRKSKSECPSRFTGSRDKYLESLAKRGYRGPTINSHKMYTGKFCMCR